jgi:preprotein translocase subunit SecE
MMIRIIELAIIVVFVIALWGVDSIITKFENKNKTK